MKDTADRKEKMPALFIGHGSPMNAIGENEFVRGFRKIAREIPKPKAIVCISAHWETLGTFVTAMEIPRTIHDFGGFPKALYEIQYPAPGNPGLAKDITSRISKPELALDESWGLDHGAWTVIRHMYPEADIPVVQMSLDSAQNPQYHYDLAKKLSFLRDNEVLIIGSGNMVHNLRMVAWDKLDSDFGYDWALETDEKMRKFILDGSHQSLINYSQQGTAFQLSIPTPEHFLPLLYILALQEPDEPVSFFNSKPVGGSLTMTSVKLG